MTATGEFFIWYFSGLNGLGGWFLFFLVAMAAVIWLFYDSSRRRLPALGWRMASVLTALLLLPTILFRFGGVDTQASLDQFMEIIFYLGLMGGVLPLVVAIGYYVTYQGMAGCERGHLYEAILGQCPECARLERPPEPTGESYGKRREEYQPPPPPPPPPPSPKANAWLISRDGRNHQLNLGETRIGRRSTNDIYIPEDKTVGREHAKIIEQNGHFTLIDLGTINGTKVNGTRVRQPMLLYHNDEIEFGDHPAMRFTQ